MRQGRFVKLRKPEEWDIDFILNILKDEDYRLFIGGDPLDRDKTLRDHIVRLAQSGFSYDSNLYLVVDRLSDHKPIGVIFFNRVSWRNRNCTLDLFFLKEERGRLDVIDAYLSAVEYVFLELGLHKVIGYVYAFNTRLIGIHEKLGIRMEQRLVEHVFRNGKYHDVLCYGFLESEFKALQNKPIYKFLRKLCRN